MLRCTIRLKALLMLAVAVVLNAACGGGTAASGGQPSSGPYHLGATGDFSGPLSNLGVPWRNGLQAYFSYVDSHGGIKGHNVELTALDDAFNATTGLANVKQFLDAKVSGVFVYSSDIAVAVTPTLNQHATPAILLAPTASQLEPPQAEIFATGPPLSSLGAPMLTFGSRILGSTAPRVGLISQQSAVLNVFAQNTTKLVKDRGIQLVSAQVVPSGAATATAQANAIADGHPNLVLLALTPPLAISAVTALRQAGLKAPIVSYPGAADEVTLRRLADADYYALVSLPYPVAAAGPDMATFLEAAQQAKLNPSQANILNGYLDGYIMGHALEKCGFPCDGKHLTDALNGLQGLDTHGLTFEPWTYSPTNHIGFRKVRMYHWDPKTQTPAPASGESLTVDQII